MDWSKGFKSKFYAEFVDPQTWERVTNDGESSTFEITDGSIQKNDDTLKESASINCKIYSEDEFWVRVWMDCFQDGDTAHEPLFTGLGYIPGRDINGMRESTTIQCYSVLKPADDILLPPGWNVSEGSFGVDVVIQLLKATPAPVHVEGESPVLSRSIVAENGESNLSMALYILQVMNWRLYLDGRGEIYLESNDSRSIVQTFDPNLNDVVELDVGVEYDWYQCPNVFRAISDDLMAIARDDDPESRFSTVSRGREIWMEETDCDLNNGETITDYAIRRLYEEQNVGYSASYSRRFDPNIHVSDIITLHYPSIDIEGEFEVTSQNIRIGLGAKTSEEAHMI